MKLPDYKTGQFKCVHQGPRRYFCVIGHQLGKRLPQTAILGLSLYVIGFIVYKAFFFFVPANVLLNVSKATIPTTRIGDTMILTLCRSSRIGSIQPEAVRTFYKIVNDGTPQDGGSYSYSPTIEGKAGCYTIKIKPSNYPTEAGTYYAYTSFKYKAGGISKESTFTTEPFLLSDTKATIDEQYIDLQRKICDLNVSPKPDYCLQPPVSR